MTEIPSENDEAWGGAPSPFRGEHGYGPNIPSTPGRTVRLEITIPDGDAAAALSVFWGLAEHFECSGEASYMSDIMSEASRMSRPVTAALSMSTRGDLRTGHEPERKTWRYDPEATA